jgi:polyhydroxyalkanoate synthesis regulator phasin
VEYVYEREERLMEISLKNLLLAGIGTMAYTYEKAADIIDELVKKGEIAVNEGKELNEELKRKLDKAKDESVPFSVELVKNALSGLNLATKQDIEGLKKRIDELEKK